MAGATREQIMTALLAVLSSTGDFVTISRRNRSPDSIGPAQSPALFLLDSSEEYERKSPSVWPIRRMKVKAIFYNDVGNDQNVIPSTAINNILDALDLAFQSDSASTGRFTLGKLVQSCMIDGEVEKAPGEITGKSIAVVPIEIVIP